MKTRFRDVAFLLILLAIGALAVLAIVMKMSEYTLR